MASQVNRRRRESGYTILATNALRDPDLSWGAKGLHAYVFQLPEEIAANLTIELLQGKAKNGRDSCAALIAELRAAGYVTRQQVRSPKGHFVRYDYDFFEERQPLADVLNKAMKHKKEPVNGKPVNGSTVNGSPENGKPQAYNNYIDNGYNEELEELKIKKAGGLEAAADFDFLNKKNGEGEAPPKAPPAPAAENKAAADTLFGEKPAADNKKRGTGKKPAAVVVFPPALDTAEFRAIWAAFIELRKKRRHPVGVDSYQNTALAHLGKFSVETAIKAIEQTSAAGWQGLFPENLDKVEKTPKNKGGGFGAEPTPERLPVAPKNEPVKRQPTEQQQAAAAAARAEGLKQFLTVKFINWEAATVLQPVFEELREKGYLDTVSAEDKKTLFADALEAARAEFTAEYANKENLTYGRRAELRKALEAQTPTQLLTDAQTRIYRKKLLFAVQQKLLKNG